MAKPTNVAERPAERPQAEGRQHLTITSIGFLIFAVLTAATGQLLLKHGMQVATARAHATGGSLVIKAATSPGTEWSACPVWPRPSRGLKSR